MWRKVLPKPMPGSTAMRSRGMPAAIAGGDPRLQRIEDIERHIVIFGTVLHGLGIALGMHEHHGQAELRRGRQGSPDHGRAPKHH